MTSPISTEFGKALEERWLYYSAKVKFREIMLFRALVKAIISLSDRFKIEEFHGSKHQVAFSGSSSWGRKLARCELSDLFVVVYRTKPSFYARMTFLQAKRSLKDHYFCNDYPHHKSITTFDANLEQWDLLYRRPNIVGINPFDPPPNLLSGALLPSVGSFSIFFKHNNSVSFFYASADKLNTVGSPSSKYSRLQTISGDYSEEGKVFIEQKLACCPLIFGQALYEGFIGTPIHSTDIRDRDDSLYREQIRIWLKSVISQHIRIRESESPLGGHFIRFLEPEREVTLEGNFLAPSKVILINNEGMVAKSESELV